MQENKYTAISYYNFENIKNIFGLRNKIAKVFKKYDVKGIVLLAPEGININISYITEKKANIINDLKEVMFLKETNVRIFKCKKHIFRKLKIKIKNEILTTRNLIDINPLERVGSYLKPSEWEEFIKSPDVILIDTRNDYEVQVGSFKKAINPKCQNFTSILEWIKNYILVKDNKDKKIAMFCTGGIRCEKASSFIKFSGFKNVYQLEGGILNYFKKNTKSSSWKGECFVFDNRVSLKTNLEKGSFDLCYACRMPIDEKEKRSKNYIKGISCSNCFGKKTFAQLNKYKARQLQKSTG